MPRYRVQFEFYEDAETPEEAAQKMLDEIQGGYAPVADVWEVNEEGAEQSNAMIVDLEETCLGVN